jgi:uncharacterized repeat protein (TIGR01451 family)
MRRKSKISRGFMTASPGLRRLEWDALEDRVLLSTFTVLNTLDNGPNTLRAAIQSANLQGGSNTIDFNIGGAVGVQTINLTSPLPFITSPLNIDGYTQPGSSRNTQAQGDDAVLLIEINGTTISGVPSGADGFVIQAGGTTVQGLIIDGFHAAAGGATGSAIVLTQLGGNRIVGNFLGTSVTGGAGQGNDGAGVLVLTGIANTIGGQTPADRNVISGNRGAGIDLEGSQTSLSLIQGNLIGTDAAGLAAVPNSGAGVNISGSGGNTIGGAGSGARNVISGNSTTGVTVQGAIFSVDLIQGNVIGADATGSAPLGNVGAGILAARNTTAGASVRIANNVIAFNRTGANPRLGAGVEVLGDLAIGNSILSNSVFGNEALGIDLGGDGVTPNHVGVLPGPNNLQNFPVITSVAAGPTTTTVAGTLDTTPNAQFTIEFFSNATADGTGFGEGQRLLGQIKVTTDGKGHAAFNSVLPAVVPSNQLTMSATATSVAGDTSEFSKDFLVPSADLAVSVQANPTTATVGSALTYVVTLTNLGPNATPAASVADSLPPTVTLVSATPSQGTATTVNGVVEVDFGALAAGASATLILVVTPNQVGPITDVASVIPQANSIPDPDVTNNSATVDVVAFVVSGVTISITADANPAPVATDFTYTITVTNGGRVPAPLLQVFDQLPTLVSFVSATSSQGSVVNSGSNVLANLGTVGPFQAATVSIRVHVNDAGPLVDSAAVFTTIQNKPVILDSTTLTTQAIYTFVVLNTNDAGFGSLRQVLLNANAHPGPDAITFDIQPGFPTRSIVPATPLPAVVQPVSIDATTQPGYAGAPIVEVDGENAGGNANGFVLIGGGVTVRGLAINRFGGAGIAMADAGGESTGPPVPDAILGNFIGIDRSGTVALPNDGGGIVIIGANPNQIGGTTPGAANVISGNEFANIYMAPGAAGNVVTGNLIGPDVTGTRALSTNSAGVLLQDAHGNTIGGSNVISGNSVGILLTGSGSSSNLIVGNRIGTTPSGRSPMGNTSVGVFVAGPGNALSNNVISANLVGVRLYSPAAAGNRLSGNWIGTDATGLAALGNLTDGVFIDHAPNNIIGGLDATSRNVISGNRSVGVQVFGPTASGNLIIGNFIGLNALGTAALGNGSDGVYIDQAPGNTIGGGIAGAGNVISGNQSSGVQIFGRAALGNVVQGNRIGTDASGASPIGNGYGLFVNDSAGNMIGGFLSAANTIRGNARSDLFETPTTLGPVVQIVAPQAQGIVFNSIVVTFNKELDPTRAQNLRNYVLISAGADGRLGTRDDVKILIASATYTTGVRTVTLIPAQALLISGLYRLKISGQTPRGVTDTEGQLLSGNSSGRPGGTFAARFGGSSQQIARAARRAATPAGPLHSARSTLHSKRT